MAARRILIAGIGNIFLGDDGFGVEVVRLLSKRPLPAGVVLGDFGIRGFDLACALQENYDAVILVDACQRGGLPGTLHVIEPTLDTAAMSPGLELHRLDVSRVFQLVRELGGRLPVLRLIGCEPANLEPVDDGMECLSEPVRAAIPRAIAVVEALLAELAAQQGKLHYEIP